jgi:diguanylate cyclase (GGDEF)-like protein
VDRTAVIVVVAAASVLGTLLIVTITLALVSRVRRDSERRVEAVSDELSARTEQLLGELHGAVERAREDGRRSRALGELGGSIDLDEVLARTLEAACAVSGVDAALVNVAAEISEPPIVATLGLSEEEARRQAIAGPPDGREARSISIAYKYPPDSGFAEGDAVHSGLAVPLRGDADPIGFLTVFSRSPSRAFGDPELDALEELSSRAAPAIENARRFREARRLADLDALTGLHNRRYFHETLEREVSRGQRYGRKLALIVFDLDDFKAINDRIGHLAGDAVLADAAERVRSAVRSADIACRVGGDEFAIVMPESSLHDADQLYRRVRSAVSAGPIGQAGRIFLSAGIAALEEDDNPTSFFERADEALYRAKEAGKGQVRQAKTA